MACTRLSPIGQHRNSSWLRRLAGLVIAISAASCGKSDGPSAPTTGSLQIILSGAPSAAAPVITVSGPSGFSQSVTGAATLTAVAPGEYSLAAERVMDGDVAYDPMSSPISVTVNAARTPTTVPIAYGVRTGTLRVTITGIPDAGSAAVTVTGPAGFSRLLASSSTLTALTPGDYVVSAANAPASGHTYAPNVASQNVSVLASATPVEATVAYAVGTGAVAVVMTGLPSGTTASAILSGPNGYQHTINGAGIVTNLQPGAYTLAGAGVTAGVDRYAPSNTSLQLSIAAGVTPVAATVSYVLASGSMAVAMVGLPQSVTGSLSVTGPAGFHATLTQSQILAGLTPGSYTIAAANATSGSNIYAPTPASLSVTVQASATPAPATISYALASGGISLQVTGLTGGATANVLITGPNSFSRQMTGTGVVLGLTPGTYTVTASTVSSGVTSLGPTPASQTVAVPASLTAVTVTVNYVVVSGGLAVTIGGLPGGVNASVTVTGPGGFSQNLIASQTLSGLVSGSYTVAAAPVTNGATTYNPSPVSQTVAVASSVASASVTYAAGGGGLNLLIDGATVTQTVQSYGGSVQLIANKSALLRVFVKATQANTSTPSVRARFYSGATLLNTVTIPAPGASVPTTVDQSVIGSSWNTVLSGSLLQPGVSMLLDVDPSNAVAESSESDNAFPVSGSAQSMNIVAVSTFQIRLVPVTQSANGFTGNASNANKDQFLAFLQKLYPVSTVDVDVRAAYTTSAPALDAGDANGAWGQILSEINALRTADASTRYYYGVVKVGYSSGVAGLGYVPGRAAIGWDYLPSAATVLTHELGHNFGRWHAPCGGPSGVDPSYPYPNAQIGVYGYDVSASTLKLPTATDVMSYCSNNWISDYNYNAIFTYRQANPFVASAAARPGLLVWGRIVNGSVVLEPAYEVVAPPSLPTRTGRQRLELTGDAGESLVSLSFDGERVADSPTAEETFAFVIPRDLLRGQELARLRVSNPGGGQESRDPKALRRPLVRDASELPVVTRLGRGLLRLTWTNDQVKGMLVRDARTGEILTFARGGSATVRTDASTLDLVVSNGVRSEVRRVTAR